MPKFHITLPPNKPPSKIPSPKSRYILGAGGYSAECLHWFVGEDAPRPRFFFPILPKQPDVVIQEGWRVRPRCDSFSSLTKRGLRIVVVGCGDCAAGQFFFFPLLYMYCIYGICRYVWSYVFTGVCTYICTPNVYA